MDLDITLGTTISTLVVRPETGLEKGTQIDGTGLLAPEKENLMGGIIHLERSILDRKAMHSIQQAEDNDMINNIGIMMPVGLTELLQVAIVLGTHLGERRPMSIFEMTPTNPMHFGQMHTVPRPRTIEMLLQR